MADKITNGSKLFLIQHGGSYGTSDNFPIEKLQLKIADKYFSWDGKTRTKSRAKFLFKKILVSRLYKTNKPKAY